MLVNKINARYISGTILCNIKAATQLSFNEASFNHEGDLL